MNTPNLTAGRAFAIASALAVFSFGCTSKPNGDRLIPVTVSPRAVPGTIPVASAKAHDCSDPNIRAQFGGCLRMIDPEFHRRAGPVKRFDCTGPVTDPHQAELCAGFDPARHAALEKAAAATDSGTGCPEWKRFDCQPGTDPASPVCKPERRGWIEKNCPDVRFVD